ncbi:MAG: hypothetical protein H7343_12240 [Undibacterium sp.]|nr:hypothetical protein [Opitutaceae bacterium]
MTKSLRTRFSALSFIALCLGASVVPFFSGCTTPPSARVVAVQSLKTVGQSAEAAVALSAELYAAHRLTAEQARAVLTFYDARFQPAFRLAVLTARSDLATLASPDLLTLAAQLARLLPPP